MYYEKQIADLEKTIKANEEYLKEVKKENKDYQKQINYFKKLELNISKHKSKGKQSCTFDSTNTFMPESQVKKVNKWIDDHERCFHTKTYYIKSDKVNYEALHKLKYPSYNISFAPSSVGILGGIECEDCKNRIIQKALNKGNTSVAGINSILSEFSSEYSYLFTDN